MLTSVLSILWINRLCGLSDASPAVGGIPAREALAAITAIRHQAEVRALMAR
jgi:hypothetical protein